MYFLYFVSLYMSFDFIWGTESEALMAAGSCSKKCETFVQTADPNNTVIAEILPKFPCSCSSSCSLYKDCCYDSPFRDTGKKIKMSHTMCLTVLGKGQYRSVSKCPQDWLYPSHFCTDSIGYLPPVTSKTTGITYANIYCAVCHGDGEDLKTWTVNLRCCPEHENLSDGVDRQFVYRRGHLWSRISYRNKCLCRYQAQGNDTSFLDRLELRTCDKNEEISRCSSSWNNTEDENLCQSFLDPVYLGDKVYRNKYCARCNYKAPENTQCLPSVVSRMLSEGANDTEIFKYCHSNQLNICLHYLISSHRGRTYTFSSLLDIRIQSCIPEQGQRCCKGEMYDYRSKRCRKLVS